MEIIAKNCVLLFKVFDGETKEQIFNVTSGTNSGNNGYFNSNILANAAKVKFRLSVQDGVVNKYAVISNNGTDIEGGSNYYRFEPNKWYLVDVNTALKSSGLPFGCYINSSNAIGSGSAKFEMIVPTA